ncbi:MAG: M28 family metallopeptidase [Clostridium celatum]|nr:M28 family metallopeptidase [Clostridium celatum]
MRKKIIYFSLLSITSFLLLTTIFLNNTYSNFNSNNVLDNIYILSSDVLTGRLAGSTENSVAGEIIKNRFKSYGLVPLDDDYNEDFVTTCPVNTNTSPYLKILSNDEEEELQYGVDFKEDMINFRNNTFSFSNKDTITSYSSFIEVKCSDGKFLFYIPENDNLSFRSSFFSEYSHDAIIMITSNTYKKIKDSLELGKEISVHIPFSNEEKTISNIVGVIKGSNSSLAPFIITAHYDHLGKDAAGTNYNGALDNASGASFMLELSRSLSTYGKPKRDIIFVGLNAEEFGLLGSKAFAEKNLFKIQNSEVINFDMIGSSNCPISLMQGVAFKNNGSELLSSIETICKKYNTDYTVVFENSSDHASFNNLNIDAVTFCHSDMSKIHTPNDTIDYIDTKAIDTVYNIFDEKIKTSCYSGFTRFVYSSQSLLWLFITLIILIAWGIFDKSKVILDKKGIKFFCLIGLIASIVSTIFYFKGYKTSLFIILIFVFSILTLILGNKKLNA